MQNEDYIKKSPNLQTTETKTVVNGTNAHTVEIQNQIHDIDFIESFQKSLEEIQKDSAAYFKSWRRYKVSEKYENATRQEIEEFRLSAATNIAKRYLERLFGRHLAEDRELLFELYHALIVGDQNSDVWKVPQNYLNELFETEYTLAVEQREKQIARLSHFRPYDEVYTETRCILTQRNTNRAAVYQNAINILAGGGGIGKSTVALELAVARTCGLSWYGFAVERGRVIYISSQDTSDRVKERIETSITQLKADENLVMENLLVTTPDDPKPSIHLLDKHEIAQDWKNLCQTIHENHAGSLVIIDHLSGVQSRYGFHQEGTHYQLIIEALQMLAKVNPVLVISHTNSRDRKCNAELDQNSIRGAVELVDGARSIFVMGETSSGRRLVHVKSSYDELCRTQMLTKLNSQEDDFE
ncbi:MAG: AAA family ATPase [Gammaproteobacteria bacterium]|nr:AAA family ATPase [Gammaproteobacteria bacterium]